MSRNEVESFYRDRGIGTRVGYGERPAIIVIDMLKALTDPSMPLGADLDGEIAAIKRLLDVARGTDVPIMFAAVGFDPEYREAGVFIKKIPSLRGLEYGTEGVEVDERLERRPDEVVVWKNYASVFFGTSFNSMLTVASIDTLIITGCTTSGCVRATAVDACQHGLRAIVPKQCVGDRAEPPHLANLFDIDSKYGDVVELDEAIDYLEGLKTHRRTYQAVAGAQFSAGAGMADGSLNHDQVGERPWQMQRLMRGCRVCRPRSSSRCWKTICASRVAGWQTIP